MARALLRREQMEGEMEAEMRHHLELEAEDLMRQGVPEYEARRQAAIAFGGVQQRKEEALEQRGRWRVDGLRRDVRIASRTLLRQPAFTVTATLALALAIAVNTTTFSVIDAMLNPQVGVAQPDQLYTMRYWGHIGRRLGYGAIDTVLAAGGRTYSAYSGTGYYPNGGTVERAGQVTHADVMIVRADFFTTLGTRAIEGRLSPPRDQAMAAGTIVISDRLQAALFHDGERAVGQAVEVDGSPYTILGVTRRYGTSEFLDTDIWMFPQSGSLVLPRVIRLRAGTSAADASRELSLLASRIALGEGERTTDARFELKPIVGQFEIKRFHWALIGAGIAVLVVACTNLANLQLARGLGRASELALRSAVGASRWQIVRHLVIESGVLAAGSLLLAIVLAIAGNAALHATIPPRIGAYVVEPQTTWRLVLFATVLAVLSLVMVGLVPALRVSRVDLNSMLKSRAGTGAHRGNQRTYGALVIAQIAMTLPLVSAAVLLSTSAARLGSAEYRKHEQYGFDTGPLITASFVLPPSPGAGTPIAEIAGRLVSQASGLADVANAAASIGRELPGFRISTDDNDGGIRETNALNYAIVSPSYFRTLGLPMERGRDFPEGGNAEPAIVMDRSTGWYLWPRSSPIGRAVKLGEARANLPWIKVVGIAGDSLSEDARATRRMMDTLLVSHLYRLMTLSDSAASTKYPTVLRLYVRARQNPQRVASELRRMTHGLTAVRPPIVQLFEERERIPERILANEFIAGLFATFGVLALAMSALGVYGIVAQSVTDREREVAVRVSLGATPRNIVRALIRQGNVLVLAGVAIGLYITKETIGWLGSFLTEVDIANALLFGALSIALFAAMVLSAFVPAFRATKLDPMEVLRAE